MKKGKYIAQICGATLFFCFILFLISYRFFFLGGEDVTKTYEVYNEVNGITSFAEAKDYFEKNNIGYTYSNSKLTAVGIDYIIFDVEGNNCILQESVVLDGIKEVDIAGSDSTEVSFKDENNNKFTKSNGKFYYQEYKPLNDILAILCASVTFLLLLIVIHDFVIDYKKYKNNN